MHIRRSCLDVSTGMAHETTRYPHIWISSANVRALSHDHWGNEESAILSVPLKAIVKANFL